MIINCFEIKVCLAKIPILVVCIPVSFQGWYNIVDSQIPSKKVPAGLIQACALVLKQTCQRILDALRILNAFVFPRASLCWEK